MSYTRKSRKYSSYRGKVGTVAPNRIRRRFSTHIPHQKITTDTSEFKYYEVDEKGHMTMHKLYLDPFMDMCNGEILSYGIDQRPSAKNVMDALDKAIEITADCPYRRTFHSDQGWAYQMKAYSHRLKEERIFQSMSRKGNCLDNSVMENFFGLLKQEIYYGVVYYSYEELKSEIERFIKYYNEKRIKRKARMDESGSIQTPSPSCIKKNETTEVDIFFNCMVMLLFELLLSFLLLFFGLRFGACSKLWLGGAFSVF